MLKPKKAHKTREKTLDTVSPKRGRGRPGVRASEIKGRADHYRLLFTQIWNDRTDARGEFLKGLGNALLGAKTEEKVIRAFAPWPSHQREFEPIASVVLKVLREPKFPKRRKTQINFLADSLAGWGWISPRRSRDICERERSKIKKEHCIIRQDFYIECTCRYKGPALYGKCPKCGTEELSLALSDLGGC
jgi:hypothetical protein